MGNLDGMNRVSIAQGIQLHTSGQIRNIMLNSFSQLFITLFIVAIFSCLFWAILGLIAGIYYGIQNRRRNK